MADKDFDHICTLEQGRKILEAQRETNRLLAEMADRQRPVLKISELKTLLDPEDFKMAQEILVANNSLEDVFLAEANADARAKGFKDHKVMIEHQRIATLAAAGLDPNSRPLQQSKAI